eukprot:5926000-Prymnesium_polylepis.1
MYYYYYCRVVGKDVWWKRCAPPRRGSLEEESERAQFLWRFVRVGASGVRGVRYPSETPNGARRYVTQFQIVQFATSLGCYVVTLYLIYSGAECAGTRALALNCARRREGFKPKGGLRGLSAFLRFLCVLPARSRVQSDAAPLVRGRAQHGVQGQGRKEGVRLAEGVGLGFGSFFTSPVFVAAHAR